LTDIKNKTPGAGAERCFSNKLCNCEMMFSSRSAA